MIELVRSSRGAALRPGTIPVTVLTGPRQAGKATRVRETSISTMCTSSLRVLVASRSARMSALSRRCTSSRVSLRWRAGKFVELSVRLVARNAREETPKLRTRKQLR